MSPSRSTTTRSQSSTRPIMSVTTGPMRCVSRPSASRRRRPRSMASAAAIACATVKLTVTLTLTPRNVASSMRSDPRGRRRQLHDDIGRDAGELDGLLDHLRRRPEQHRVRLDREPALPPGVGLEHGLEQPRPLDRHVLDNGPREVRHARVGAVEGELRNPLPPEARILVPYVDNDGGVRRRPDRSKAERVLELVDRTRVVPDVGGRVCDGSAERTVGEGQPDDVDPCGHGPAG